MKWQGREGSSNVEDRRGKRVKQVGAAGIGIGTIVLLFFALLSGGDPQPILDQVQQQQQQQQHQQHQQPTNKEEDVLAQFVSVVLKDTEVIWTKIFKDQLGHEYKQPKLVLYSGHVSSACGNASSATGPFYCPGDFKLYIDLSFYQELQTRFKAPGDFAMAYIVAHEVGHHVQNLLGITTQVQSQQRRMSKKDANALSVRLELQADFFAGVWAHYEDKYLGALEQGDLEEALTAASAVGDDHIQKQAQGYVVPDAFTHGTSKQRMSWFYKGLKSGKMDDGDTFTPREI